MIIIGIDPGLGRIGYGVLDHTAHTTRALAYGCITSPPNTDIGKRLLEIEQDLVALLKKWKPDRAAVEELFFAKNVTTAFSVGLARGVVILALARLNIPIVTFSPPKIKLAVTGYGAATKRQVQEMVKRILGLSEIPKPDDAADALAVALCGSTAILER